MDVTVSTFEQEVLQHEGVVMVDFWATWCGPCKMFAPIVEEIAQEYEGRVKVCKVDVDANSELASKYGIMSIPTVVIFQNGEPVEKAIGARSKAELGSILDQFLA